VCQEPLNHVSLHYQASQVSDAGQEARRTAANAFCTDLTSAAMISHKKLKVFEALWPEVMDGIVANALKEFENLDSVMNTILEKL